jgi:ATP synthase proteolipid subunit
MIQPFFGAMGCTAAIVFTCLGASYGTAKSGVGIAAMGVLRPDLIVKSTRFVADPCLKRHKLTCG